MDTLIAAQRIEPYCPRCGWVHPHPEGAKTPTYRWWTLTCSGCGHLFWARYWCPCGDFNEAARSIMGQEG